jgi:DNA polymerase-3 subunit alpha
MTRDNTDPCTDIPDSSASTPAPASPLIAQPLAANSFVHLHLHTQYSLLDGANKLPDVLEQAKAMGQSAIAITDHGNMHGVMEFFTEAKKIGIKPIIGCELYLTSGSRFERKPRAQGGEGTFHLTVLAQNKQGYHNLCKLVSLAYREGFYHKPRVDHELLEQFNEGLIVLSGCLAGELAEAAVRKQDLVLLRQSAEFYARVFKDRFYLEIQPHQIKEQQLLNQGCLEMYQSLGLPLVATTDCHYPGKDDHFAQEVLMCVSTAKVITDPTRLRHEGVALHLKSAQEMLAEFGELQCAEQAIKQSTAIAELCELDLGFERYYMPRAKSDSDEPLIETMATLARTGLTQRIEVLRRKPADAVYGAWQTSGEGAYWARLEEEIKLIEKMGFAGYFLVVADFIVWAKEHGVPVGPGRGSVAGSLVAYAMRITEVDPLRHKLLFERFLNPERISMPDIDVDFCIHGRQRVIHYVIEKYGKENVSQICTFGTLKAKAALKDVGRALGMSFAETDRIAQLVPAPRQGFDYPIAEALKMEPRLAEYAQGEGKQLIELAQKLEGLTRHTSTHAAGVVIGDRPLTEILPMMVDKDGNDVTQYSMTYVEKIGLVKFDFLGLKTLSVIYSALDFIKESKNLVLEINELPLDDQASYRLLCSGNTTGVFQLESSGITEMTMRLKPSCFDDLVAILALYRPGPLDAGMVEHYINRKHGREPVSYLHPLMKTTLEDTYGIILYQEQIMQLARELAGYSLAEADLLRKAMGKKNPEEMARQRERFLRGTKERSIADSLAAEIFDQMETFARYGFNRSHSAAYALVSYQTAYLKTHYPVEFMAALMTHDMGDTDKTLKNLTECRKANTPIAPPDINESVAGFLVRDGRIRYGLAALKGVGEKAVEMIIRERKKAGSFTGLEDFCERVDLTAVNRRVLDNLIKAGAFDFSGSSRRSMIERLDEVLSYAQSVQAQRRSNQMSLFGAPTAGGKNMLTRAPQAKPVPEWPINQRLAHEREALGFYISGHPVEKFMADLKRQGALTTLQVKEQKPRPKPAFSPGGRGGSGGRRDSGSELCVGGVVTALKLKNTKKGDRYASFVLEDCVGTIEALVWPDVYKQVAELLTRDEPMLVRGRADITEEHCVLIVNKLESLIAVRDRAAREGLLSLRASDQLETRLELLCGVLGRFVGPCPVKLQLEVEGRVVSMALKDAKEMPLRVSASEGLCEEVEQLFGRPVLSFV